MLIRLFPFLFPFALTFAASPSFPVLTYSTYLRNGLTPSAIATDSAGNIYLAGNSTVMKLNPQGTPYIYVQSLGGSANYSVAALAVDSAGNAYVTGTTAPLTFTPLKAPVYSFVAKLDPQGNVVFNNILGGGNSTGFAQAIAVNASGQIIVSGTGSFPATPGAFTGPSDVGLFLMELDATGTKTIFSASGIGGGALALDPAGNIYVAGSTTLLDYPTTPGSYQPAFPVFVDCPSPDCFMSTPGTNQYLSKLDPAGSKLIYSTSVSGNGDAYNAGLAVDVAGNAYLTGYNVDRGRLPEGGAQAMPFLSKLDAAGQKLLYSVPVGGAGIQLDGNGAVYVAGNAGLLAARSSVYVPVNIPALASVPAQCLTGVNSAYVAQADASTGNLLGSQFIAGSTIAVSRGGTIVTASAIALARSTVWVAGNATLPGFPTTPNVLGDSGAGPGAYLGAVDFSQPQPPAGTPTIGCILDSATLGVPGPVARYQLLSIFGTALGPASGVSATGDSTTSLGGVNISFSSMSFTSVDSSSAAPLLYASSKQINFAVPLIPSFDSSATMQLTVNGIAAPPLQFPLTSGNPNLFPAILNADGSLNSSKNPSALNSTVSVFVNGLSGLTPQYPPLSRLPAELFTDNGWQVKDLVPATTFVLRVDLQVPANTAGYPCGTPATGACPMPVGLYYLDLTSPLFYPPPTDVTALTAVGTVYVSVP